MTLTVTTPEDMTKAERAEFIALVKEAGEVDPKTLPRLVDEAVALVTIYDGETLIGTAALKRPSADYRKKTFKKAGEGAGEAAHPLELGWVHVHNDYECQGHGQRLVQAALDAAKGAGVYATTKNDVMRRMLPKLGFGKAGGDYPSKRKPKEKLSLFTRPPKAQELSIGTQN
ncbi:MAG: GNAT family N-acetyltransferase [Paracoccaceae bacterium]|nr:MAG: GNAT family N-acetyltransferase [Paracoccaceae bacterium]